MDLFLPTQALLSALSLGAVALVALALGLGFYGYVADQVVFEANGRSQTQRFGSVDAAVAALLTALFMLIVVEAIRSPAAEPDAALPSAGRMVAGVAASTTVFMVIVGGILGGLSARQIRWREVFGLDRQGPGAVVGYAGLLLALALPLISGAALLSKVLLAAGGSEDDSSQELVRFLGASGSPVARWVVAASAVLLAPVLEEFVFRGFLYGVVRRYAGATVGILFNATLFAAIHTHLPSFGGLFVLAVCLTLAYEWTGSIFVPITMHALFNALSVVTLLLGGSNG